MLSITSLRLAYIPPLFFVTVCFILGIVCYHLLPLVVSLPLFGAVGSMSYILFFYTLPDFSKTFFYCLIGLILGAARSSYLEHRFKANSAQLHHTSTFRGEVVNRFDRFEYPRRSQLMITSNEYGTILATTKSSIDVVPGDTIKLKNVCFNPSTSAKFTTYLQSKDCAASTHFKKENLCLIHRPLFSLKQFLYATNQRLLKNYQALLSRPTLTCFYALFLGNKQLFQKSFNRLKGRFNNWGLAHFLARSGLHLVMFIAIWITLFRFVPLAFFIKQLLLLLLVLLYILFSWSSIPFTRAMLAYVYQSGCSLLSIQTHPLQTISLVALILLYSNPYQLFLLEFQLTMSLTFGLLWFYWKSKHLS